MAIKSANNQAGITVFFELFNPNCLKLPSLLYKNAGCIINKKTYIDIKIKIETDVILFLINLRNIITYIYNYYIIL